MEQRATGGTLAGVHAWSLQSMEERVPQGCRAHRAAFPHNRLQYAIRTHGARRLRCRLYYPSPFAPASGGATTDQQQPSCMDAEAWDQSALRGTAVSAKALAQVDRSFAWDLNKR